MGFRVCLQNNDVFLVKREDDDNDNNDDDEEEEEEGKEEFAQRRKEKGERKEGDPRRVGKIQCIMVFSRRGRKKTRGRGEKRGEREVACDTGNGFTWRDGSIHVARSAEGKEERRGERG